MSGARWRRWGLWRWTVMSCHGPEAGYYPIAQGSGWALTERSARFKQYAWSVHHEVNPLDAASLFGR